MMLYLTPDSVDMSRAVKEDGELPGFSRKYSASGVFGDPTLASVEKGQHIVNTWLSCIQQDLKQLRNAAIP